MLKHRNFRAEMATQFMLAYLSLCILSQNYSFSPNVRHPQVSNTGDNFWIGRGGGGLEYIAWLVSGSQQCALLQLRAHVEE
jgi:hypothetical protein